METMMKSVAPILLGLLLGACGNSGSPTALQESPLSAQSTEEFSSLTVPNHSIGRESNLIPPWTPSGNDFYSRKGNDLIEPINVVIRGPVGTLDTIRNRLTASGKWGYVWGISYTNHPLPCFDKDVTFRGSLIDYMLADDVPGVIRIVPGNILTSTSDTCGTGTRNHARIWKEVSQEGTYETIYIAASMETVRDAFPVPSPQFNFSPTRLVSLEDSKAYYMGISDPKSGINCNNANDLAGVSRNWHFRVVVPVGATIGYLRDSMSTVDSDGIWRESNLGCDSNKRWPILAERNPFLSNANGDVLDLYLVPAYEAIDGNPSEPRKNFYLDVIQSFSSGAQLRVIEVEKCDTIIASFLSIVNVPAVHCLTEDTFNIGRERMVFDIDNALRDQGVGGASYSLDSVSVGHTQLIEQPKNSGFNFAGDGLIKVFNISSIAQAAPPLRFNRQLSPIIGTNCNNAFDTSGVSVNLEFEVLFDTVQGGIARYGHIPENYFPLRLYNGSGGVWRNEILGCSLSGNWPMYAFKDGTTISPVMSWKVYVNPYGAFPGGSASGYYILEFGTSNASDPLIYSKLEF